MDASVSLLLKTYKSTLPDVKEISGLPGVEDTVAASILRQFHPAVLQNHYPRRVDGDGNCLYRAASLALYDVQDHHVHLRLLTALEMLQNPRCYDSVHPRYIDLIKDIRIVTPAFPDAIQAVTQIDSFLDMLHIYALSAVLSCPLRSYYPPVTANECLSEPFSRKVVGRGVKLFAGQGRCI
jgi:hypothetical protein